MGPFIAKTEVEMKRHVGDFNVEARPYEQRIGLFLHPQDRAGIEGRRGGAMASRLKRRVDAIRIEYEETWRKRAGVITGDEMRGEAQGADMKNPMAGMISKKFEITVTCN